MEQTNTALTEEETTHYESLAEEIRQTLNPQPFKVYPVVLVDADTKERVVAYIKEPNYLLKLKIMDKSFTQGLYSAADELRELCIIKDKSDERTYGEEPENDKYKLGVTDFCITLVKRSSNQYKKK